MTWRRENGWRSVGKQKRQSIVVGSKEGVCADRHGPNEVGMGRDGQVYH